MNTNVVAMLSAKVAPVRGMGTTDGVMMLGAYEWAFVKPVRTLYYNMTITVMSVAIALLIGGIETLGLVAGRFHLHGPVWHVIVTLNENTSNLGFVIIGVFLVGWLVSYLLYRIRRLDTLEVGVRGIERTRLSSPVLSGAVHPGARELIACRSPPIHADSSTQSRDTHRASCG